MAGARRDVRLGNTILGPIDGEARSANWYMVWSSKAAKKTIAVRTRSTAEDGGRAVSV
jgi:hypothetical protein